MRKKGSVLNPEETVFAEVYAGTEHRVFAATQAGYKHPAVSACQALQRPAVQAEITRIQTERLYNDLLPASINRLEKLINSDKTPAGAQVQAIKLVLDRTLGNIDEGARKEIHEMTADEINQALAKLRDITPPVLEGKAESGVFD